MPEHLRAGCQKRHDRRLIDVAPLRVLPADDEVQLVPEKAIMGITYGVDEENDDG